MAFLVSSGKTTFEEYCKKQIEDWTDGETRVHIYSTITAVKELASQIGWSGSKTPKDRKFLSDLKDLLTQYNDYPLHSIEYKKDEILYEDPYNDHVLFVDCREPEEIQKLKDRFKAKSVCVRRPCVEGLLQSNHADAEILETEYDYTILNNGTLEDFYRAIDKFIYKMLQKDEVSYEGLF